MSKINNIKTIYGAVYALGLLAILALGILLAPTQAQAQYQSAGVNYSYNTAPGYNTNQYNYNPYPYNYNQYPYQQPYQYVPAQQVGYNTRTIYVESPTSKNTDNTSTSSNTSTTTKKEEVKAVSTTTQDVQNNNNSDKYNELAANAIFGDTSFTPSGLLQWILFAILILVIIILVRKVFGKSRDYYNTPLKHA